MALKICLTISGARPSDGSSSSSRRGRPISARAIASICCSPPDKRAAALRRAFLEPREHGEDLLEVVFEMGEIVDRGAHLQVLEHRHARKDAAAFGRLGDRQARDLVRRHAGDVLAGEDDRAAARARLAEDRHHHRRLAGAVGADQGDDLAFVDVDVDALERLDLAVEGLDAAHRSSGLGAGRRAARHGCSGLLIRRSPLPRWRVPPRRRRRDRRR